MAAGTIYTYPENFRAFKALIAAQYSNADVKVASDFVFGETNKSEDFLKKFPAGKVPAFESADGKLFLTESNAIAYYVSNQQLRGATEVRQAQILQWLSWADSELLPASCAWLFPMLGIMQYNKNNVERAKTDLLAALTVLNNHLLGYTFLVGERISLADICVFTTVLNAYKHLLEPSKRKEFGNVSRWFDTLVHQKQFEAVLGEVKLCESAPVYDPKKFQDTQKKTDSKKDKKPEKKEQPKETESKEENDDEPEVEAGKDGSFDMDDFKRFYSNEEEAKSIPYFWQKFDPENYSIWFAEYKYPEELSKVFMSCNLITGMFQRLDKMRKIAFASAILFGDDNNSTISAVWVWKGHELAFKLSPDWQIDYESYDWKKLDPNAPETKELVKNYFSWTGTDKDGRKFNQGKIFK